MEATYVGIQNRPGCARDCRPDRGRLLRWSAPPAIPL